jgi:hypothetical protein
MLRTGTSGRRRSIAAWLARSTLCLRYDTTPASACNRLSETPITQRDAMSSTFRLPCIAQFAQTRQAVLTLKMRKYLFQLSGLFLCSLVAAEAAGAITSQDHQHDLGHIHFPVSCTPKAQGLRTRCRPSALVLVQFPSPLRFGRRWTGKVKSCAREIPLCWPELFLVPPARAAYARSERLRPSLKRSQRKRALSRQFCGRA